MEWGLLWEENGVRVVLWDFQLLARRPTWLAPLGRLRLQLGEARETLFSFPCPQINKGGATQGGWAISLLEKGEG